VEGETGAESANEQNDMKMNALSQLFQTKKQKFQDGQVLGLRPGPFGGPQTQDQPDVYEDLLKKTMGRQI
jgi:hypothetical protein